MRHDGEDKRDASEQPLLVGYKRPPVANRFQKGRSGNPAGRPRKKKIAPAATHSIKDVESLMLEEAYRLVSIREGDKVIQLPTIQAVMRGLGVAAIKGNHRAQVTFKEHTQAIESKLRADKQAFFEAAAEYKWNWEREFEKCDQLGKPRPDPVPHPDDIILDVRQSEVRFVGPQDDLHKAQWDILQARKQKSLEEINALRDLMKREPKLRRILEEEIAYEQYIIRSTDYYLPDEATRRHPLYDPNKRGKPPERFKFDLSAKPAGRATKAAGRRRSKAPEE